MNTNSIKHYPLVFVSLLCLHPLLVGSTPQQLGPISMIWHKANGPDPIRLEAIKRYEEKGAIRVKESNTLGNLAELYIVHNDCSIAAKYLAQLLVLLTDHPNSHFIRLIRLSSLQLLF